MTDINTALCSKHTYPDAPATGSDGACHRIRRGLLVMPPEQRRPLWA